MNLKNKNIYKTLAFVIFTAIPTFPFYLNLFTNEKAVNTTLLGLNNNLFNLFALIYPCFVGLAVWKYLKLVEQITRIKNAIFELMKHDNLEGKVRLECDNSLEMALRKSNDVWSELLKDTLTKDKQVLQKIALIQKFSSTRDSDGIDLAKKYLDRHNELFVNILNELDAPNEYYKNLQTKASS